MQTPDSSVTSSPPPPPYDRLSSAAPSFTSLIPQTDSSPNGTDASQNSSTVHASATLTQSASAKPEKEPFDKPSSFDLSRSLESSPSVDTQLVHEPVEVKQPYKRTRRRLFICLVIMILLIIGVTAAAASTIHSHHASQSRDNDNNDNSRGHNSGFTGSLNPGGISLLTGANSNSHQDPGTATMSSGAAEPMNSSISTSRGSSSTERAASANSNEAPQATTTPATQAVVNQGATVNNAQVQTTQPVASTTQEDFHGSELCGSFPDLPGCTS